MPDPLPILPLNYGGAGADGPGTWRAVTRAALLIAWFCGPLTCVAVWVAIATGDQLDVPVADVSLAAIVAVGIILLSGLVGLILLVCASVVRESAVVVIGTAYAGAVVFLFVLGAFLHLSDDATDWTMLAIYLLLSLFAWPIVRSARARLSPTMT